MPLPWSSSYPASLSEPVDSVLYAFNTQGQSCTRVLCSYDPNDIIGPEGEGEPMWVAAREQLDYQVRFENDSALAQAAAQVVSISVPLDSQMNLSTLRLGDVGLGSHLFDIPEGRLTYTGMHDLPDSLGYDCTYLCWLRCSQFPSVLAT